MLSNKMACAHLQKFSSAELQKYRIAGTQFR